MKQTAVEWLEQEMLKPNLSMEQILEQAKELEKQQLIHFCYHGSQILPYETKDKAEQYYNQTFKK
jgi:hypothetical protein